MQGAGDGAASLQASAVLDFELEMVRCCARRGPPPALHVTLWGRREWGCVR